LNDLYFLNADTGFCIGSNGTLLKTTNGGSNWMHIPSNSTANFQSLYFMNSQTGWICGYGSAYQTNDGGNTLIKLDSVFGDTDTSRHLIISNIIGAKDNKVILSGFFSDVPQTGNQATHCVITTDGGISWQPFNVPDTFGASGYVQFVSPTVLYSAGFFLYKSEDGGISWTQVPNIMFGFPPLNWRCFKIFDTAGNGWASLQYEINFATLNNINDTLSISDPGIRWLVSANFENNTSYFLQSNYPNGFKIFKSTDKGHTLDLISENTHNGYWRLYFLSDSLGYVCGDSGRILKYNIQQTAVSNVPLTSKINIFPNPTTNTIYLQYDNLHIRNLQLIDLSGRLITSFSAESKSLDVSGVAAGLYFLQIKAKEGEVAEKVEIR